MSENQNKKGWSWLGFFFAPFYYAGYGELKKGLIYAIIWAFPLFGLIIAVISGKNARKDLPVGKQKFNWINVAITSVVTIISTIILQTITNSFKTNDIDLVKNGVMNFNKTITVGEAFDNWDDCKSKKWFSFKTKNHTKVVEFTCEKKNSQEFFSKIKSFLPEKEQTHAPYLDIKSINEVFQWTINKDKTFQIDNVQVETLWNDGKMFSDSKNPIKELTSVYNDNKTWDLSILDKRSANQIAYALSILKNQAK